MGRIARFVSAAAALVLALTAQSALAQDALQQPRPPTEISSPKYLMFAIAILLLGATVFVMVLKPKRGHQD